MGNIQKNKITLHVYFLKLIFKKYVYLFKLRSPNNLKTKPIPPIAPIANNTNLR